MLPTQFHSFGEAVLEEKLCVEIDQSETRLTCGCHVCKRIGTFHKCFLPNFSSFWAGRFRGEDSQKLTNQKQELPVATMFVNGSKLNEQSLQRTLHICSLPISSLFGQAVSEKKIFRNFLIKSKNCLWRPCLLTDRDEIRNLHKRHFIDALQQVSVYLSKQFQRRRFRKN